MREAAIISTARTGLAKAMRGGFNKTHGITLWVVILLNMLLKDLE